jgi:diadenosine tetraphosphate (Ap4A) HIT family hydrolase
VFHVHFHVIPKPDDLQGLGVRWPAHRLDSADGASLAAELQRALA